VARAALAALVVAALVVAAMAGDATANGRFPAPRGVTLDPARPDTILLQTTFGLLISRDAGESFHWVCESAIGYGGTYDPDYAVGGDGAIYATTFEGLVVTRDGGCTWTRIAGAMPDLWVGAVTTAPDGAIWAATSSGGKVNDVYVSRDDGATFAPTGLHHDRAWWKSIAVAPSEPRRLYVSGYRIASAAPGDDVEQPRALLYRSDDGGASWAELPVDDFAFGTQPLLFVLGALPDDPDTVFARVEQWNDVTGGAVYRSSDAGASWTRVLEMNDAVDGFLIPRVGGLLIAGTPGAGVRVSADRGVTWTEPAVQPRMQCVAERGDGTIYGCGANWAPDYFALASSTDASSWMPVHQFQEIAGPLACEPGTIQHDGCAAILWPSLAEQLGVPVGGADAGPVDDAATPPDAGAGAGVDTPRGGGCGCNAGLAAMLAWLPLRRRR
jgi:photosystem II stability/assembly factor-like uncharacterized protein